MVLVTLCPRSGSRIGLLGLSVAVEDLLIKTRALEGVDKFEALKTPPGNNHDGVEALGLFASRQKCRPVVGSELLV